MADNTKQDEITVVEADMVVPQGSRFTIVAARFNSFIVDHLVAGDGAALSKLAKWQTKVLALRLLAQAAKIAPTDIAAEMPRLVPLVSELMWETSDKVKAQAG